MDTKDLIIIGAMFAGLLALKWALGNLSGGGGKKENTATAKTFPYGLRDAFLSPAEISFFHVLKEVLGPEHYLVTKVRLEDLFFVRQPHRNRNARNLIAQKHVDFVICDAGDSHAGQWATFNFTLSSLRFSFIECPVSLEWNPIAACITSSIAVTTADPSCRSQYFVAVQLTAKRAKTEHQKNNRF